MQGLMQDRPLLIWQLLEHGARHHGNVEIVSRRVEGDIHRYTYRDALRRSCRLANAIDALGIAPGERIATLAWNGYRHFELYYGVSGSQRILHTLNPRLTPEQLAWIVADAEDRVLCFDLSFLPLVQAVHARCPSVRHWIALCDAEALPKETGIPNLHSYEAWIGARPDRYDWPEFDERTASALCYTSGTTGNPKGVLYSHRSTLLHALAGSLPDSTAMSAEECVLPVVPMFHVNGWGVPYSAPMTGAKVVFPGPALDGKSVYDLIESEGVTLAAGVPTVWLALLAHVNGNGLRFSSLRRSMVGGSACAPAMVDAFRALGVDVLHGWGMTEMSPLGTLSHVGPQQKSLSLERQTQIICKQGKVPFGVDMKIVDDTGAELPWDGVAAGDLHVRGPWVVSRYFGKKGIDARIDGWFPTGDVATIDPDGNMQITDRSKDVIKSGGEWISSIDIENIALAHPAVAIAACIAVPHPKWDERPLLIVVPKPGATVDRSALLDFYAGKVAKWQVPDDVVVVDAIPLGATGKIQKNLLRDRFRDHVLPSR